MKTSAKIILNNAFQAKNNDQKYLARIEQTTQAKNKEQKNIKRK
jgi:hypothetical protein